MGAMLGKLRGAMGTMLVTGGVVAMPGTTGLTFDRGGPAPTATAISSPASVSALVPAATSTVTSPTATSTSTSASAWTAARTAAERHPGDALLAAAIRRLLGRSGLGGRVGVAVRHLDGAVVVRRRASLPLLPASNEKLLTLAATIAALGPGSAFSTRAVTTVPIRKHVVRGNLFLIGGGDPTLSTRAYARIAYGTRVATVEGLAAAVRRAGVRRITGHVVVDASLWDARRGGPGWKASFLPSESTPLSAVTINRSTAGRAVVWRPEAHAAALFSAALRRTRIVLGGRAAIGRAPAAATIPIASVSSPPLATLAVLAGKHSDNFLAESLLKDRAAYGPTATAPRRRPASTAAGAALALRFLRSLGVETTGLRIADGSGLSLDDRQTADAISQLLLAMHAAPTGPAFRNALAVGGVDGTLRSRLTTVRGLVQAKTGTLDEASALSGYAGDYVFSVIVNGSPVSQWRAHALQDAVATLLARAPG